MYHRHTLAVLNFSITQRPILRDQGVIWCHMSIPAVTMIFAGLPDPVLCCDTAVHVPCSFCEQETVTKICRGMREWVFETEPICPCPLSRRGFGQTRLRPSKVQADVVS